MKILLAKRRALGDTVLLSATVELFADFPDIELSVLIPRAYKAVFEKNPNIKNIFLYEDGFFTNLIKIRSLKLDYYLRLHAPPNWTFLPRLYGAKKLFFHTQNKSTEKKYGKHPNALEWDFFFLQSIFDHKFTELKLPKLYLSKEERAAGEVYWKNNGVDPKKIVFLGLGASRFTKRWPARHFARLAELLRDRLGLIVLIVTGPGEEDEKFSGSVVDAMRVLGMRPKLGNNKGDFLHLGGFELRKLMSILSCVKFYIGNDSGPKHLSLALGIPTFTFFGPEDPVEWHPYSRDKHPVFFEPNLSCRKEDDGRWCSLSVCVQERHKCMEDLRPEEVIIKIEDFFRNVT